VTVLAAPSPSRPPIAYWALAVGAFGALIGGTFPISVIFSLGDIGGGLSVSADDAAWVTTLYNVGQIVAQPLLMIMVSGVGRGRSMRISGAGFALASLAVAVAPTLAIALCARLIQGVFGGMLPTIMMLLVMTTPVEGPLKVAGLAAFSLSASLGVGLGAPVGAFLADLGGWRVLFEAQCLAGFAYFGLSCLVLRQEAGDLDRFRTADWGNFVLVGLGLSLLTVALGEGERRFWFESWWITAGLACGLLATGLAVANLLRTPNALLRLEVFERPTLGWALGLQLAYRFGLMATIAVIPQYLARTQGFRIEQLAPVLAPLAVATLVAGPFAWWASCRHDARISLSLGLGCFALAAFRCTFAGPDWAAVQFLGPVVLIGVGQAFFGVAVLRFATFGVSPAEGPTVGVLFNYARVFGLVGGLAIASHVIAEREKFHSARLVESLNSLDPAIGQRLVRQSGAFAAWIADSAAAQRAGVAGLARAASGQAFSMAYADAFAVIAGGLLLSTILVWALPRLPTPKTAALDQGKAP
jgi:DHA2 family multidrug resistance protein